MSPVRRALVMLVSVTAAVAGFTPAIGAATITTPEAGARSLVQSKVAAPDQGYWTVARDGGIFSSGGAAFHGSTGSIALNRPIVGMASTPSGNGYWLVASDGGIFSFGDAAFHGSTGSIALNRPIVGMASTASGNGYSLVASDGGIFSFGDAAFHGSTGSIALNRPIVGMASTPSGNGYWLVASDGGIFSFGDAMFHGSTGGIALNRPIVGMAATRSGNGYWFAAADGGVFAFGDAQSLGSSGSMGLNQDVVGIAASTPPLPVVVPPDPATKLAFSAQPSDSTGGMAFATQPEVTVQDASGATVATDTSSVTLTITTPAGALLSCTNATPRSAVAGIATFTGCNIDQAGTYTLHASDGTLTTATSAPVTITVGNAAQLGFTAQPSGAASSVIFTAQPHVAVQDLGGNTVTTTNSGSVTLTITQPSSPAGAALTCTNTGIAVAAGVAVFAGCKIDLSGSYTLHAVDGLLTPATSNSLSITAAGATKLAFTTSPSPSTGGVAFTTQPVVKVEDVAGNTVTSDASGVTLTITTPAGALLNCTNASPLPAASGVATFTGCKIDLAGTYTLHAADGTLTTATSNSFAITVGTAAKIGFTTSPNASTGGVAFTAQPVVAVQDLGGNTVTTTNTGTVALTITQPSSPAGAALTCTNATVAVASGVAAFAGCKIDLAGAYTLHAVDGALTTATSNAFNITVGPAAGIGFTTSPNSAVSSVAFTAQPVVAVQDLGGNTVTATNTGNVALTITQPSSPAGAALTCTNPIVAVASGVAAFAGCKIDLAGTYTLHAVDGTFTATSSAFTITFGAAAKLGFTTSPSASTGGVAFTTQPVVAVQDLAGNTVTTTNTGTVALTITQPSSPAGAALTCTNATVAVASGVAAFAGCKIDLAGTYTLHAVDAPLTTASSNPVTITIGSAAKLGFTAQPSGAASSVVFTTQPQVAVQDLGGNTVTTTNTGTVTLTITQPSSPAGAALTCTSTGVAVSAGVAAFAGCSIDLSGTYTLHAVDGLLSPATSNSLSITAAGATKLVFTTSPNASTGGVASTTQPVVTVEDVAGNTVTSDASGVTLTITTPNGALLSCTNVTPLPAVNGVATFTGCKIDLAGTYTLHAADGTLTAATSSSFAITVGTAAKIGFTTSPSASTGGVAFTTQPVVAMQDLGGNTVTTTNTTNVVLTITQPSSPARAVMTCTNSTVGVAAGLATFAGCNIDLAGTYTLHAGDGAFTATSNSVAITVGAAAKIGFTASPNASTGGTAFTNQPTVAVQDLGGNTVTTGVSGVTLTITQPSSPAGAALTCTNASPLLTVAGVATFTGCKIDLAGTYTLHAVDGSFSATSNSFGITVGTAAKLAFTTSPNNSTTNTAFSVQPVVKVEDLGGNVVVSDTSSVALTITTAAGATLSCSSANPLPAINGVAAFTGCRIDLANSYTLGAADLTLATDTSAAFTISSGG